MIIKFDKRIVRNNPQVYEYIEGSYTPRIIRYVINSKYRRSVILKNWLDDQMRRASEDPDIKKIMRSIKSYDDRNKEGDYDQQVIAVLSWVINNIRYVGDVKSWGVKEYWQDYRETVEKMTGDCEDGAVLAYVLCRLKGVPVSRLLLFAGSVVGGGHCWLGYRPTEYPLNWAFIDWCYWPTTKSMNTRPLFYVNKNTITGFEQSQGHIIRRYDNYKTVWFGFNERTSFKELVNKYGKR